MPNKLPGSLFQKTYIDRDGNKRKTATWYARYSVNGRDRKISTNTTDKTKALRFLRTLTARYDTKRKIAAGETQIGQLLDLLVDDYHQQKRSTAGDTEARVNKHLRPMFGDVPADELTTTLVKAYIRTRQASGDEDATINKELSWLRRAMYLGLEHEPPLVERVPKIKLLPVQNTRTGTVTHEQYLTIRDLLPPHARIALVISYHTGARKGEIRKILKDKIDFARERIELAPPTTKNKNGRYLPIYGDMAAELELAINSGDTSCPFLVQHEGKPVGEWKKSWATACRVAKIPAALFHDLRRTALTNMIDAGLSEKEAMEISGHKTRHVFDRYHIVSPERVRKQAKKLEAHLRQKEVAVQASAQMEVVN